MCQPKRSVGPMEPAKSRRGVVGLAVAMTAACSATAPALRQVIQTPLDRKGDP